MSNKRKSRNPDAVPRDPCDSAIIVVLPVIHSLNAPGSGRFVSLNERFGR